MTDDERRVLHALLERLEAVRLEQRDPDADAMIRATLARQPDAAYLLVQRALLQDEALQAASRRIEALEREPGPGAGPRNTASSFLAGGWGRSAADPRSEPAPTHARPSARGGSFLGTAAATAAGVAGGAFLFQGLSHLVGQRDPGGSHADTPFAAAPLEGEANLVDYRDSAGAADTGTIDYDDAGAGRAGIADAGADPAGEDDDAGANDAGLDDAGLADGGGDFGGDSFDT